jgi:hypothetical protein
MILIDSLRRDLELILSTKNIVPLVNINVRIALLGAFGLCDRLCLTEVSYEFGSGDDRAEVGGRALDVSAQRL